MAQRPDGYRSMIRNMLDFTRDVFGGTEQEAAKTLSYMCCGCRLVIIDDMLQWCTWKRQKQKEVLVVRGMWRAGRVQRNGTSNSICV